MKGFGMTDGRRRREMNPAAAVCAALAAAACAVARAEWPDVRWMAKTEVSSGYLSSAGTLGDTWPCMTQSLSWSTDLGDGWSLSGYGWTVSSLHNRQRDKHRALFNQFETAVYGGYDMEVADGMKWINRVGPLWNPAIGYENGHNCDWGLHYIMSLKNDLVVPYANALWMIAPSPRSRIRLGICRTFAISDVLSVEPFVETVWMDNRRYQSKYGGLPQDRFLGGAFATMTTGVVLTWDLGDGWKMFVRLRQFDVINSQSRRAVKNQTAYYAKCDWPVASVGFTCSF